MIPRLHNNERALKGVNFNSVLTFGGCVYIKSEGLGFSRSHLDHCGVDDFAINRYAYV
jgi:hypothetical protein